MGQTVSIRTTILFTIRGFVTNTHLRIIEIRQIMNRFFIPALLFLGSLSAYGAEGVRALPDTAEAMGLAGGRFILLDDASVARTNPASLTRIHDTMYQVTYQAWHGKTDYSRPNGVTDSMVVPWKHTGSLYIAHPLNDTMTAGLGVSAPFGVSINWPRLGAFRYTGAYDATLQTAAINPSLGLKINDEISIGFGLDIYRSKLRLEQRFPWAAVPPAAARPDGDAIFDGSGWGLGGYVGVNFDLGDRHHIAIVGRLPVSVDYKGRFSVTNVPAGFPFAPFSHFRSEIEHPGSIGVGYGYDVSEKLSIAFDFEWIQNSTHDDVPLNIGVNQAMLAGTNALPLNWDDSVSMGFGFEYQASDQWTIRGGYLYSDNPGNQTTYNPSLPTDDRHILSAGVSYTWGLNTIDFAYTRLLMDASNIQGNVQPAFNGSYAYDWNILTLSYQRRF